MSKNRSKRQKGKLVYQQNGEAVISLNHAAGINDAEKAKGPVVTIKFKHLAIVAYLYMVVPILIFFVSWLRWYIGFPMAAILTYGLYILLKTDYLNNNDIILLPTKHIIFIALAFLVWVWLSGQGGFFYQTGDNHTRNAIFRDMIDFNWPVIYPKTGDALVYYLMYWIVPALFGKMFGWLGGNIALALWTYTGIIISYLLITYICKAFTPGKLWVICIVFITWSGLNLPGMVVSNIFHICNGQLGLNSAEGWLDFSRNGYDCSYLYRSNNDALSQVYNQTVIPWLAVPMILDNRKVRNFAFIGLCILPYAPIPFIGFIPVFLIFIIPWVIEKLKQKNYREILKDIFSIQNVSAVVTILIVTITYLKTNLMGGKFGLFVPIQAFDMPRILTLLLFYTMEFGVICFLIFPMYKHNFLFYTVIISLILIPLFKIGDGRDFCMNASFAVLFILMIMTMKCSLNNSRITIRIVSLIIVLTITAASPLFDIMGRLKIISDTKQFPIVADNTKTLSDKNIGDKCPDTDLKNYLVPNPENKAFFKYLARK